ncbi:MAG: SEC-C domain-containing protein, partial [Bacteroidetes bacterium]|nr:SEC-C domain-containing protein [Bacteroidota bacterium]
RLDVEIYNMMYDVCESVVTSCHGFVEFEDFKLELIRHLSMDCPITEQEYLQWNPTEIIEALNEKLVETYKRKTEAIARQAFPVIKDVFEKSSHIYENIVVPITDGYKIFQVITNLKKANENDGREVVKSYRKTVLLALIDEAWKEHLREMDDLKQSVQAATYEQKDPLLIYKFESFELFKTMMDKINKDVVAVLMKGHIPIRDSSEVREAQAPRRLDMSKYQTGRPDSPQQRKEEAEQKAQPVRVEKKVGRNDPCPCGSGKKFKHCHGVTVTG